MVKNLTIKSNLLLSIVMISLLIPVFLAHSYIYNGVKWSTNSVTVDFGSASIPSTWVTPIAQGITPWNNASSPFTFSAGSSNNDITVSNLGTGSALAIATVASSGSTISYVDLVFNSSFTWSTSGESGKYDVRNVATHEFGHFLSLADLSGGSDTEKTMYFSSDTGETKKRSLHSDDINGINFIYP